jgi:hypothetical protein
MSTYTDIRDSEIDNRNSKILAQKSEYDFLKQEIQLVIKLLGYSGS